VDKYDNLTDLQLKLLERNRLDLFGGVDGPSTCARYALRPQARRR
jgi:hypothetical protein